MISVEKITHRYGARVALANVSFDVKQGEIFGLLGPNGGGKSTLFRILSTMMVPTEGRAVIAGYDVEQSPAEVRKRIGVVFQTQSLDKALTVGENLRDDLGTEEWSGQAPLDVTVHFALGAPNEVAAAGERGRRRRTP